MSRKRLVAALFCLAATPSLGAQSAPPISAPITSIAYAVTADKPALERRRLAVTMTFDVADNAPVLLSLPAWTPGAYEISNFSRWVASFPPTQNATPLKWDKLDYDTWRIRPARAGRVTVAFDYLADTLDNAMSWTKPDFALFNGTNLFLYPEGRSLDFVG